MKTEKWVPCTEKLALNPERVKAWRLLLSDDKLVFIAYDKEYKYPLIFRVGEVAYFGTTLDAVECLIEVSIQERFVTFYEDDFSAGSSYGLLGHAIDGKELNCTHIVKLTYDGKDFKAECVWTKEST